VRFYAVLAREVKRGNQIFLAKSTDQPLQKVIVPELESLKPPRYRYLVQRPHEWRQQLYVKGRRLTAATVFKDYRLEKRTPQQIAEDWDLPLDAVLECIYYCQENQALLAMEAEEDVKQLAKLGVKIESAPSS
jgi:uncharacterized protein (DUF433 family)